MESISEIQTDVAPAEQGDIFQQSVAEAQQPVESVASEAPGDTAQAPAEVTPDAAAPDEAAPAEVTEAPAEDAAPAVKSAKKPARRRRVHELAAE
ncbi:MAG: hypothetical protein QM602_05045, partial [Microbacterium sp.]